MKIYTTSLPSLPGWQVKIRAMVYNGGYVAITSLPIDTGMVTVNRHHPSEHTAVHQAIDAVEELAGRIQYPFTN